MSEPLRQTLERYGARFADGTTFVPRDFGDVAGELDTLFDSVAWSVERPAVVLARGPDFLDLLHRLSTQDMLALAAGGGCPTVLTSPKGRIVERLWCHHLGDEGVVVLGGPDAAARIEAHLDRFTFAERTGLHDASDRFVAVAIHGRRSGAVLERLACPIPEPYTTRHATIAGVPAFALGHDLLSRDGLTVLAPREDAEAWLSAIAEAAEREGGRAVGAAAVEAWRIARGLPGPAAELTEEHNPLEAGLLDAVHFSKGCYVGQEVVARLRTYDKVARRLMVVLPEAPGAAPPADTPLYRDDREIGTIRSVAALPRGTSPWLGLAYVKRTRAEDGASVRVGDDPRAGARILDPPVDPRG